MRKANFLEAFLSNPTAVAIAIFALAVIAGVWFYTQMQENKNAEAQRAKDRGHDSIWND